MIAALSSALGGLQGASARFERAAVSIVNAGHPPEPASGTKPAAALGGKPIDRPNSTAPTGDIVTSLVDLRTAAISYKASIAAMKVAEQMQDSLLDITS